MRRSARNVAVAVPEGCSPCGTGGVSDVGRRATARLSAVEEVARRLVALAPAERGAVNVCSGEPISVREFVETGIRQNRWSIRPKYGEIPYADYEPMAFWGEPWAQSDRQGSFGAKTRKRAFPQMPCR